MQTVDKASYVRTAHKRGNMIPVKTTGAKKGKPPKSIKPILALFKEQGFFVKGFEIDKGVSTQLELEYGETKPRIRIALTLYAEGKVSFEHLNADPRMFYTKVVEDEVSGVPMVNESLSGAFALDQVPQALAQSEQLHNHNFKVLREALDESLYRASKTKIDMVQSLTKALANISKMGEDE